MGGISRQPATDVTTVNEYSVLRLTRPASESSPGAATHYLYVRPNDPKVVTATTPCELFLVNIPIDSTTSHLRSLFNTHLGGFRIASITFDSINPTSAASTQTSTNRKRKRKAPTADNTFPALPTTWDRALHASGSTCILTFVDETSAASAMRAVRNAAKSRTRLPWADAVPSSIPSLGLARYKAHHALRYPDAVELQASVDAYMGAFNEAEAEKAKDAARRRAEPDEDGFVTVTRGGRNKSASETAMKEVLERQKKKMAGRDDFYRFQGRERRREEAMKLRRGFEEDRKRVEGMRTRVRPE